MIRQPIIRNSIIIIRCPIINRVAIFHRKPVWTEKVGYARCYLCNHDKDCKGIEYVNLTVSEDKPNKNYRVIHIKDVDYGEQDWVDIEGQIWELEQDGVLLRLIIDCDIPDRVLWALSYNARNILQIQLNLFGNPNWVTKLIAKCHNCGVYSVICLYPIIPDVIFSYRVLYWISALAGWGNIHFDLLFSVLSPTKELDGYINFNGRAISAVNLSRNKLGNWICSDDYIERFMEIIQLYTIPRKISVGVCGKVEDCTGFGGKRVTAN